MAGPETMLEVIPHQKAVESLAQLEQAHSHIFHFAPWEGLVLLPAFHLKIADKLIQMAVHKSRALDVQW